MSKEDYCLVYECPLKDIDPELLHVCSELGESCETCDHRCP